MKSSYQRAMPGLATGVDPGSRVFSSTTTRGHTVMKQVIHRSTVLLFSLCLMGIGLLGFTSTANAARAIDSAPMASDGVRYFAYLTPKRAVVVLDTFKHETNLIRGARTAGRWMLAARGFCSGAERSTQTTWGSPRPLRRGAARSGFSRTTRAATGTRSASTGLRAACPAPARAAASAVAPM